MNALLTFLLCLFLCNSVTGLVRLLKPHPRNQKPVSLEGDLVSWLVTLGILVWINYLKFWG